MSASLSLAQESPGSLVPWLMAGDQLAMWLFHVWCVCVWVAAVKGAFYNPRTQHPSLPSGGVCRCPLRGICAYPFLPDLASRLTGSSRGAGTVLIGGNCAAAGGFSNSCS